MSDEDYTLVRAWAAEGARVGITSCRTCGAALLIDPADTIDVLRIHAEWHERTEAEAL